MSDLLLPVTLEQRVEMIRHAAASAVAFYMDTAWIENDDEGFTGWRWDKHNVTLKIVTAANRYGDFIVTGARHHSPTMHFVTELVGIAALREYSRQYHNTLGHGIEEQGFIDQYGTYWTREDAMQHCLKTGQPLDYVRGRSEVTLFSEHLH